jgi:hypothetical protein
MLGALRFPNVPGGHNSHCELPSKLQLPAEHCPEHEADVDPPSPNFPALHGWQAIAPVGLSWYCPPAHCTQWSSVVLGMDTSPYLPTTHATHLVAAASLCCPTWHDAQAVTADTSLNDPAMHSVHTTAPAAGPVSVIDPAWHGEQYDILAFD